MPRFAANLSFLYQEWPFLERFAAAAQDGFEGVEFLFPYEYEPAELARRLADAGLRQVLFNAPVGGATREEIPRAWGEGQRGTLSLPGPQAEAAFREGVELALEYAQALDCPRIHVLSGIPRAEESAEAARERVLERLRWAAERAAPAGRALLLEPINQRDMPGYYLRTQAQAHALVQALGSPAVRVQMDLYHCQVQEGDVAAKLREYLPTGRVGHMQVAGAPARNEPDTGELRCEWLFEEIDRLGWQGWIGCEYRPAGATRAGLGWLRRARAR